MNRFSAMRLLVFLSALSVGAASVHAENLRNIGVMTQNIYQGTELEHVAAATTPLEFVLGVATDYTNVGATNFNERAAAIAAEIARDPPMLVGLQEVALWRTGPPSSSFPPVAATTVALAARGLYYTTVIVEANWDVHGTGLFPFGFMDVGLTERTAIIARAGLPADALQVSNTRSEHYTDATSIPVVGGGALRLEGSWVSVDAKVRGKTVRFITTHLDPFRPDFRATQVQELLNGPAATDLPVVLTGDLNATTVEPAYGMLIGAGFTDTWLTANPGDPGLTCCQVPPDTIINPTSQLSERVDYVLTRGGLSVFREQLIGADPADRTISGLWPSDHAGIVATIGIPPLPANLIQ